jgi:hypothetical protein
MPSAIHLPLQLASAINMNELMAAKSRLPVLLVKFLTRSPSVRFDKAFGGAETSLCMQRAV